MTTPTLRSLQNDTAALLLYRNILDTDIGDALLLLLERLYDAELPSQCLVAYADWFALLASVGQSWQSFLVEAILYDDNPFTDMAQRLPADAPLEAIAPELRAAASHDLEILQQLYRGTTELGAWVQQACQLDAPPVAPSSAIAPCPIAFETATRWPDLLPELVNYHRRHGAGVFARYRAFRWQSATLFGIPDPDPISLDRLVGYDRPHRLLTQNTEFLLAGAPAQNVLLYGARGSGKSSLVKAIATDYSAKGLRSIEVDKAQLRDLPQILDVLRDRPQKFVIFVDDLSFEEDDDAFKALKVVLEGSSTARASNVVVYATSNRRHLIREFFDDRPQPRDADEIHSWDTVQEKLSFSDRFGLTLTFQPANQDDYLTIVRHLAREVGLTLSDEDLKFRALQWATQNNGRSGRTARQFIEWALAEQQCGVRADFGG
ncbi:MAG: ATP-binding protein [Geitlerinemataceae cyanobacterium]